MEKPLQPVADLVVAQPRFALAAVEAFFDAVFSLGDARELLERGIGGGIREVIVVLESSFRQRFARDEQDFCRTRATRRCASLDAAHQDVETEWSLPPNFKTPIPGRLPSWFNKTPKRLSHKTLDLIKIIGQ